MLEKSGTTSEFVTLAAPTDAAEKASVCEIVGDKGTVFLDWPVKLAESAFDVKEYETVEDVTKPKVDTDKTITVMDCIEKFCDEEQLEETEQWYCNRCQKHVCAWKQFHIYRSPPHLIIHLKRFHYSGATHRRDKIGVFIDFPLESLDLTEHVSHWTEEEKPIYDCYAVSNHFGGLGGGHYTAHALNTDGVWCHYDDSRVTSEVDPKDVVSNAAYVLYYRRRDVPVGRDFEMKLQTPGLEAPAIIPVPLDKSREPSEASSSGAMAGDDEQTMDVDEVYGASRSTSPMGSVGARSASSDSDGRNNDSLLIDHDYNPYEDHSAQDDKCAQPLQ
jgi:hypothetical protein